MVLRKAVRGNFSPLGMNNILSRLFIAKLHFCCEQRLVVLILCHNHSRSLEMHSIHDMCKWYCMYLPDTCSAAAPKRGMAAGSSPVSIRLGLHSYMGRGRDRPWDMNSAIISFLSTPLVVLEPCL
jgi:hypothetical protein